MYQYNKFYRIEKEKVAFLIFFNNFVIFEPLALWLPAKNIFRY